VQERVLLALARLEEFDKSEEERTKNSKTPARYLNSSEQLRYGFCRGVYAQGRTYVDELVKAGHEEIAGFFLLGANSFKIAWQKRREYLDDKALRSFDRAYEHLDLIMQSSDKDRFTQDRGDDKAVNVLTDSLYDLAQFAMVGCNSECNGKKKDCMLRDFMVEMRIPVNENTDCCPYWLPRANKRKGA
jgi:hypothetical protein